MIAMAGDPILSFRPLARADLALFGRWLDDPVVHRWWPDSHQPAELEADYGPAIDGTDATEVFVVELDCRPVGIAQRYPLVTEPDWAGVLAPVVPDLDLARCAGIDYVLGPADVRGHGVGTHAIEAFTTMLFAQLPTIDVVVVAVAQENRASWRALEHSGYHRVWAGMLDSDDPSDAGPSFVLTRGRAQL